MSSVDEILTFDTGGRLNLAAALKQAQVKKEEKKPKSKKWSSSTQSDSDSGDEGPKRRRKRRRGVQGSVAARLKQRAAELEEETLDNTSPPCCQEERCESTDEKNEDKDSSPPPSPLPSPPPLFIAPEPKQSKTLLEADQLLQELKQPQEYSSLLSESFLDSSSVFEISGQGTPSTSSDQTLTMRVRCRGKIHRFTINKEDPLILICADLSKELGVKTEQVLLSHCTATLNSTSSPTSLGLSTVDIIDAVILQEDQIRSREVGAANISLDSDESIILKVQTSKKSVAYSLAKTDTLSKVMTAFAAVLEVPVSRLQFTFDGDPVSPDKTPNDLDMDNDDIIDARLLS